MTDLVDQLALTRTDTAQTQENTKDAETLSTNVVVELSTGAIAVGGGISADDYLLFLEKSQPPRKPGSSARAIGQNAAIAWLISQSYTVNGQPLHENLMDELGLELQDFNSLVNALVGVEGEAICNDDVADITQSKDFDYCGRNVKRKPISWRYGMKLQTELNQGRVSDAYGNLFKLFWLINDQPITEEMMKQKAVDGGVGGDLAVIIFNCLNATLSN